ncbi:MFS transporter [Undibacterium terreum]|uniref:MFS transporter n=1 Tax=Undibacterium terreum TaxID=1224302 RepID=A0A916UAA7_9BURK|nr:MFS transporter [Undibacterium terreum]GGC66353.1 hypothetical protein GCM10011396_11750 [Undibacterium terreum]
MTKMLSLDKPAAGIWSESKRQIWVDVALTMLVSSAILYADFMNVIILGMHEKLSFSLQTAGDICSLNLLGTAVGSLVAAIFARKLVNFKNCAFFTVAIALLDVSCIFVTHWQALYVLRGFHGLASGGLLAFCGAALSQRKSPERIMGASLAIQLALASGGAQFLPRIIQADGLAIVFIIMSGFELLALALLMLKAEYFSSIRVMRHPVENEKSDLSTDAKLLFGLALFSLFLFQASRFMVVGFGFQIGDLFSFKRPFVGSVIGFGNWLSGAGALIATLLPRKTGRALPLIVAGIGNFSASIALVTLGHDPMIFALATCASALFTFVALPYHYGVCFAIDKTGALGIWTAFISKMGLSVGPAMGGFLISKYSLTAVLWLSAILVFTATTLACWPGRVADRCTQGEH